MDRELSTLREAILAAGERALELQAGVIKIFTKPDHTPVTSGDLEVNRLLHDALLAAFPDDAWLSEEDPDTPVRLQARRVWVVDPIDGTKYFIDRVPEFAISVALVEEQAPLVAAVFNPATKELFTAARGRGARLNDEPIRVATGTGDRFLVLGSPPAMRKGRLDALKALVDLKPMGSLAYTLAVVAAGRADAMINLSLTNEWDVAAGVLLVQEAGGVAYDRTGGPFRFNQADTTVHGVIAGRPETVRQSPTWLGALGM